MAQRRPSIAKLKRPNQKVDISAALRLRLVNKLSYADIAEKMGVQKQAVHQALQRFERIIDQPDELEAYRRSKSDLLEAAEMKLISKIVDEETISKASLNNAAYAFAQLHNAGRLERGKSTSNIDIKQTSEEISALEAEYRVLQEQLAIKS